MKEKKKMGFYKDEQEEKVVGIKYVEGIDDLMLRGEILSDMSSKSGYKQVVIFKDLGDTGWSYMSLTQFIPIEKIKNTLKSKSVRVYFKYEREGYWIVEGEKRNIDRIKESPEVIDFEQTEE